MKQDYLNFRQTQQKDVYTDKQVKRDPFLFVNNIIRERIKEERLQHYGVASGFHLIVSVVTQPLNVIGTLMQLSVKQHKHIHDSPPVNTILDPQNFKKQKLKIDTKAVTKINKNITMTEKKKIQMQILSGVKHKPFTAPVYEGYRSVLRDLYNQGYKSFFKGSICSNMLQVYRGGLRYGALNPYMYKYSGEVRPLVNILAAYTALTAMDIAFNYIHLMESRFILQSNVAQFSTYRGIKQFMLKHLSLKKTLSTGWKAHFSRNFFIILGSISDVGSIGFVISYLMSYPITTAYKRMLCQTEDPGMIPTRYASVWHALKLTLQQQGVTGLYKGVLANGLREVILYATFYNIYIGVVSEQNAYWTRNIPQLKH